MLTNILKIFIKMTNGDHNYALKICWENDNKNLMKLLGVEKKGIRLCFWTPRPCCALAFGDEETK